MDHCKIMKKIFKNHYIAGSFFIFVIFALAIMGGNNRGKPLENVMSFATKPFSGFFSSSGFWFGSKFEFLGSIGNLKNENEKLFEENIRLKSQLANLKDVKSENEQLRKKIDLGPADKYEMASASIVGRETSNREEVYYINKGSKDGIGEGMAVVVEDGIYIGKILKVTQSQSQVEFLLSKNSRTNVEVVESSEKGIVRSEYGTSVILDMIPQTTELQSGDTIVTSGLSGLVPRGLLVGYIKDIAPSADQLFQKASVILPVNVGKIRIVSVIKSNMGD